LLEHGNYNPEFTRLVAKRNWLLEHPFSLLDVGCAGGIDLLWRHFEPAFKAIAFDPQISEIEKLASIETNPSVQYVAAFVGLPDDHSFHQERALRNTQRDNYFNPFGRSSAFLNPKPEIGNEARAAYEATIHWQSRALSTIRVPLAEYVLAKDSYNVDFIKIDTDGTDFEALLSSKRLLEGDGALGVMIEGHFT